MQILCGGMAELVDALDSKSCGLRPCQFESDYPYQIEKPWFFIKAFYFFSLFHSDFKAQIPSYKYQILGIPSQNEKCSMNFFGGANRIWPLKKSLRLSVKKRRFGILLILI